MISIILILMCHFNFSVDDFRPWYQRIWATSKFTVTRKPKALIFRESSSTHDELLVRTKKPLGPMPSQTIIGTFL